MTDRNMLPKEREEGLCMRKQYLKLWKHDNIWRYSDRHIPDSMSIKKGESIETLVLQNYSQSQ